MMLIRRVVSALLPSVLVLTVTALPAQNDLTGEVARLEKLVANLQAAPGTSFRVNGQVVPHSAWQRSLVYLKGTKVLEEQILLYIIEERIEELSQEKVYQTKTNMVEPQVKKALAAQENAFKEANPGKSWDEFLNSKETSRADRRLALQQELVKGCQLDNEKGILATARHKWSNVDKAEVERRLQDSIKAFKQKMPDEDFWDFLKRNGYTKDGYLKVVRSTLLFQKLFFGGKPWDWPAITKEAIFKKAGAQGKQFFDGIVKQLRENPKGEVPPMFMGIFQRWVLTALKEWADIKYASNGLEEDVVLSFNGRKFTTAVAYARVKSEISDFEKQRAVQQVVLGTALRQALVKTGFYPTEEEFAAAWKEHCKPYEGSPFNIQVIAITFKHYPSMEVYRERFRLMHGYKKMMEKQGLYGEKSLIAFVPEIRAFLGEGAVDAELIRFTAKDEKTGQWKASGHAGALAQAEMVMQALEGGSLTFAEAKKLSVWGPQVEHAGVFNHKTRNEMRKDIGEGEYTDFLTGFSVGDLVFDKAPEGKVVGPLRGLDGYYIVRVNKRYPPVKSVSLDDASMREMILQEYQVRSFLVWANKTAAETRVE